MSSENKAELKGKVVRWVERANWGVINYYPEYSATEPPRKVFLHISRVVSAEKPQLGSRVIFNLGPARSATELPTALNARIIRSAEAL